MHNKLLLLMLLIQYLSSSQIILWESEYLMNSSGAKGIFSIIKDSEDNYISTVSDGQFPSIWSYFLKFDSYGNLINSKNINIEGSLMPMNLYYTEKGYRIFCAITFQNEWLLDTKFLPFIINTNKNGDTLSTFMPYYIRNYDVYRDSSFLIKPFTPYYSITDGKNFYNSFLNEYIPKINEPNTLLPFPHLIVHCFDSLGRIVWRKGYDTLIGYWSPDKQIPNYISLKTIKKTPDNNILFVMDYHKLGGSADTMISINVFELNYDGEIINKVVLPIYGRNLRALDIVKTYKNNYIILIQDYDFKPSTYFLRKVDANGEIISDKYISPKYVRDYLYSVNLAPDNNLIILGEAMVSGSLRKMLIQKFDTGLNKVWDIAWNEYDKIQVYGDINNILFLDENNFIVIGYKDLNKFFIAKINDGTSNYADEKYSNDKFSISPNPATIHIVVSGLGLEAQKIEIYNVMGERAKYPTPTLPKGEGVIEIDVSSLQQGIYFVKATIGGRVEIVKFVKVE